MTAGDAVLWSGLVLLVAAHGLGRRRLARTAGGRRLLAGWRGRIGWVGIAVLVVALAPPMDRLGATALVAHMAQHLLLLLVAAPALVAGHVVAVLGAAAPRPVRERRRHRLGHRWSRPLLAAGVLAVAWWVWHLPGLYTAAQTTPVLHGLEHVTMLGAAWLFWAVVLDTARRNEPGAAIAAVFATALHMAAMAALLSFAGSAWLTVPRPVLDPLVDQQLAGGLLWFPGGTTWIVLGTWLVHRWLAEDERLATA